MWNSVWNWPKRNYFNRSPQGAAAAPRSSGRVRYFCCLHNMNKRIGLAAGKGASVCRSLCPVGLTRGIQGEGVTRAYGQARSYAGEELIAAFIAGASPRCIHLAGNSACSVAARS